MRFSKPFAAAASALTLCLAAAPAYAQMDPASFKEHPVVKHYPGALIDSHDEKEFDATDLVVGYKPTPKPAIVRKEVEGRVYKTFYIHQGGVSALQVMRNYETALKAEGFTMVVSGKVAALPSMETARDGALFGAFTLERGGQPALYVNILIDPNVGEPVSRVVVVEPEQMKQVYAVDASKLYAGLTADGRIAVYGVNFETAKAVVSADSEPVLTQVRDMLTAHPELKLKIEGHTDNVGASAANLTLSQQRAAAVKAWLVKAGISQDRLTTAGHGDSQPVAANDTEDGRSKNRRVELVRAG
ncbi:OmpA family protein [Phenylobacterium sp.]|jgi:outer membrane protein OmpA-like peptidoglycan-associated protein|uniref:OmpA family protein n=1 Tax=Phenylobacterium sp. TaxID=1871053 RepID=UPI0035ADBEC6|nr:OmpA family protein [Pseudomonadota bacterium]